MASAADAVIGQLCYFDQDLLLGLHSAVRSLNSAEVAGPSPELAKAYATAAVAASLVPLSSVARFYAQRARDVADGLDDIQARAWVLELVGFLELDAGRWDVARKSLEEAVAIAERTNDWRRWSESIGELARLDLHQGNFARGRERFALQYERACRRGHEQPRIWGIHGQALNCLRMGRDAEALALLKDSPVNSGGPIGVTDAILGGGLSAVAHLRAGKPCGGPTSGGVDRSPHRLDAPDGRIQPRRLRGSGGGAPGHRREIPVTRCGAERRRRLRLPPRVRPGIRDRATSGRAFERARALGPRSALAGRSRLEEGARHKRSNSACHSRSASPIRRLPSICRLRTRRDLAIGRRPSRCSRGSVPFTMFGSSKSEQEDAE